MERHFLVTASKINKTELYKKIDLSATITVDLKVVVIEIKILSMWGKQKCSTCTENINPKLQ